MWPRDDPLWDYFYNCRPSRISEDGDVAFFKVQLAEMLTRNPILGDNTTPPDLNELEYLIWTHEYSTPTHAFAQKLLVVTRVGTHTNDTYFSDAPIPKVTVYQATNEISLNWKQLFSSIFREEYLLSFLKAAAGIHKPATPHINLEYPIVIHAEITNPYASSPPAHRPRPALSCPSRSRQTSRLVRHS
jgi:hypothetical protein